MTIDLSILDDELLNAIVEDLIPDTEDFPYPFSLHESLVCERRRRDAGSNEPAYTVDVRQLADVELYRAAHRTLLTALAYQSIKKDKIAGFFMTVHDELFRQILKVDGVPCEPCDSETMVH